MIMMMLILIVMKIITIKQSFSCDWGAAFKGWCIRITKPAYDCNMCLNGFEWLESVHLLAPDRWVDFDPWCNFKFVTPEGSQNHLRYNKHLRKNEENKVNVKLKFNCELKIYTVLQ
jgi:hypothetical protein